ncbi:MAG TPA: hypothetical protein VF711_02455 [Acidimicrobiales bacterium]
MRCRRRQLGRRTGDGKGELAGACSEVHHLRTAIQPELDKQRHLVGCVGVLLFVIAGNVVDIKVLPPCTALLVEQPAERRRATCNMGHTFQPRTSQAIAAAQTCTLPAFDAAPSVSAGHTSCHT